jgi:hypothetical protein
MQDKTKSTYNLKWMESYFSCVAMKISCVAMKISCVTVLGKLK